MDSIVSNKNLIINCVYFKKFQDAAERSRQKRIETTDKLKHENNHLNETNRLAILKGDETLQTLERTKLEHAKVEQKWEAHKALRKLRNLELH
jgi:hypothetical protein